MPFYKGNEDKALTFYRGECVHPDMDEPKWFPGSLYFGDLETAIQHALPAGNNGDYYTSRIYPVKLVLNRLFVNQPDSPFLLLSTLINKLGRNEVVRIAKRFYKAIESTENWKLVINKDNKYKGVVDYLSCPYGDLNNLYLPAKAFFSSLLEVRHLQRLGYDGAIHAGVGEEALGKVEYCVFDRKQVYSTVEKEYLQRNVL